MVFAYSDDVPHGSDAKASTVLAAGADFRLMGVEHPGKIGQTGCFRLCSTHRFRQEPDNPACVRDPARDGLSCTIRHPMPYGDLVKQKVQRFATYANLDKHECTIEEREEYEPHIDNGVIVYAGVDGYGSDPA